MNVPETMNEVLDMSDDEGMTMSLWGGRLVMVMSDWVSVASRRRALTDVFRGMFTCCVSESGNEDFHTLLLSLQSCSS